MAAPSHRGFILQPTYRIEGGRPVVHLYGVLEGGGTFLVRDGREVPHFYVAAADAELAGVLGARPLAAAGKVTMAGLPALRVEVATPPETPPLRDRLLEAGIACYEADVRFAMRYLIGRGIRSRLTIRGEGRAVPGIGLVFGDPEIAADPHEGAGSGWAPDLSVLSFDIETDPRGRRLLSIALCGCGVAEVLMFTPGGWAAPPGVVPFPHERDLLAAFCRRVRELDPDALTGWNVTDFDFPVLARLGEEHGVPLELGRGPGAARVRPARSPRTAHEVVIPGRLVLDGLALVRGAFLKMESYSLDAVAREVLGTGKLLAEPDRAEEIVRLFKEDRAALAAYNATDARLVLEILDRLQLVELAVARSLLTGLPPDRVAGSIAAFDTLYLAELSRRGVVAPSVARPRENGEGEDGEVDDADWTPTAGGHVLEPVPGLHERVLVFDFKSLYPSVIRTFNLDPLGWVADAGDPGPDPILAPNGARFRREPGILPAILDRLFPVREAAKARGDGVASYAVKILMNSFYGVLATPACRFYNPQVANAITGFGRELLLWSKAWFEARGHAVLYGDTDSLFVVSGAADDAAARRLGTELASAIDRDLAAHVAAAWRVESRLEMEFDRLYRKLFLPSVRHGGAGARKRYAGLQAPEAGGAPEVVFTGMEAVRTDWTDLARRVQRDLYERFFLGHPVGDSLRRTVADLRAGRLDELLVYRKSLRKPAAAYTATTPPHVAAARKLATGGRTPPRRVAYVITTAGPEPAAERAHPLDYQHYVDKQLRPVAEPILDHLGLDFARVVGDDRQLDLWS